MRGDMPGDEDMGAAVFYEMSAKLKRAGHSGKGGLRNKFHAEIREQAKPLLPAVRRQAAWRFPSRGGLAKEMSKGSRYRTVAKTGLETAGVSIRATKSDSRADRQGRIPHPIPGPDGKPMLNEKGRRRMAVQRFPEAVGFFSDTIEERAPQIQRNLLDALERWADDMGWR